VRVAVKLTMVVGTIPKMDEDELPVLLQRHDGKSRRTVIKMPEDVVGDATMVCTGGSFCE